MTVLVTGGAGFIGSNLARRLIEAGSTVRILDNLSTGRSENLEGLDGRVETLVGDLRDRDAVRAAVDGVEVVFHLGALPSVARSLEDPLAATESNVTGTLNVLMAAVESGVRRVVYASSSSVYGDTPTLPKHEEMPVAPLSPYAASKLAGEAYCRAYTAALGLETVSLRFFNVFGPRQDPGSEYAAVIPRFVSRILAGEPPVILGDGRQSRDFTFVENAVDACVLAAETDRGIGEVMNVGCGDQATLLDLVDILNDLMGAGVEPVFAEPRRGDVRHSRADISRAERLLGYRPSVSLRDGLALTVEWFSARIVPGVGPAAR